MLRSLKIENFRCFQNFELQQLGILNLLVGKNNTGKTSILEAIQLLISRADFETLEELMLRRGEYLLVEERGRQREIDIKHLFYGHVGWAMPTYFRFCLRWAIPTLQLY